MMESYCRLSCRSSIRVLIWEMFKLATFYGIEHLHVIRMFYNSCIVVCYCVLINLTNADSHSFVFINNSEKINHMNYSQFIVLDFNSNYLFII